MQQITFPVQNQGLGEGELWFIFPCCKAEINCSEDTSFETHLWHSLLQIDLWISFTFSLDVCKGKPWISFPPSLSHVSWIWIVLHPRTLQNCCFSFPSLVPFFFMILVLYGIHLVLFLTFLLLFVLSQWKSFPAVSGITSNVNMEILLLVGWD